MKTIQQILNTESKIPVILAPMAGVTDLAFREICMEYGCDFTYSEMVSAKAVSYNNKNTTRLMTFSEDAKPFGIQIFGHEPQVIGSIAEQICKEFAGQISLIDINMGCPAPKIVNNGDGSALMKNPVLASKVIEQAVKHSDIPVTVKFRKGWDSSSVNAVEFAKMAEESGASAITIHGRTRAQMYSPSVDLDIIAAVKAAVKIPVTGNGDIIDSQSAAAMLNTGCDAIMIGRAAQGNPFIFEEIKSYFNDREYKPITVEDRIKTAMAHAKKHEKYKSTAAFVEMRKHIAWYTKGIRGSSKLRTEIFTCETIEQVEDLLENMLKLSTQE